MIQKLIQGFQKVLHILYNMFEILILLECPCRAEVSESITDFKGYYWYGFMEYIENINACDDVFSEYCLDDENMSIQPEWINTPEYLI